VMGKKDVPGKTVPLRHLAGVHETFSLGSLSESAVDAGDRRFPRRLHRTPVEEGRPTMHLPAIPTAGSSRAGTSSPRAWPSRAGGGWGGPRRREDPVGRDRAELSDAASKASGEGSEFQGMATERLNRTSPWPRPFPAGVADEMSETAASPWARPGTGSRHAVGPVHAGVALDGPPPVPVQEEKDLHPAVQARHNVRDTMKDREGRKTAPSLIGELSSRVFPVAASTSTRRGCSCSRTTASSLIGSRTPA